jgi:hypothetical protein
MRIWTQNTACICLVLCPTGSQGHLYVKSQPYVCKEGNDMCENFVSHEAITDNG